MNCVDACTELGPIGQNLFLAGVIVWGIVLKWRLAQVSKAHVTVVAAKDDVIKEQAAAITAASIRPPPPATPVQMPVFPQLGPWGTRDDTPPERPSAKAGDDEGGDHG